MFTLIVHTLKRTHKHAYKHIHKQYTNAYVRTALNAKPRPLKSKHYRKRLVL
jgi:hypothetical protein